MKIPTSISRTHRNALAPYFRALLQSEFDSKYGYGLRRFNFIRVLINRFTFAY